MARELPLSKGKVALVDDEDWGRVSQYKWHANYSRGVWYARRNYYINNQVFLVHLHRFILGVDTFVDHKNGDGLDCRRENLRVATLTQNLANTRLSRRNTSGYRGVHMDKCVKHSRKWKASMRWDGTTHTLGYFATAEGAARAYDKAALDIYGEFARPNFPMEQQND